MTTRNDLRRIEAYRSEESSWSRLRSEAVYRRWQAMTAEAGRVLKPTTKPKERNK